MLIGETLLLRKLVIKRRFTSLICLLLGLTHLHLSLGSRLLCSLISQPKISYTLTSLEAIVKHIVASGLLKTGILS